MSLRGGARRLLPRVGVMAVFSCPACGGHSFKLSADFQEAYFEDCKLPLGSWRELKARIKQNWPRSRPPARGRRKHRDDPALAASNQPTADLPHGRGLAEQSLYGRPCSSLSGVSARISNSCIGIVQGTTCSVRTRAAPARTGPHRLSRYLDPRFYTSRSQSTDPDRAHQRLYPISISRLANRLGPSLPKTFSAFGCGA